MKQTPLKRTPFHGNKHRRTKATDIPQEVKDAVFERDGRRCLWTGQPVERYCANAHFIRRSHGGLGIEQNILTLSPEAHRRFDQGTKAEHDEMYEFFRNYLSVYYTDWGWTEEKLIYKKGCT